MAGIRHEFESTEPQGGDPSKVSKNEWHAPHLWDDLAGLTVDDNLSLFGDLIPYFDQDANQMKAVLIRDLLLGAPGHAWEIHSECFSIPALTQGGDLTVQNTGTGSGANPTTGAQNHPGILAATTGTTATGRGGVGGSITSQRTGGGKLRSTVIVRIPILSTAAERFKFWSGWGDVFTLDPIDGIFFRYIDNVNAGKFERVTRQNNVETVADTGITVVAGTWYRLGIEVNAAGTSVEFFVDDASVGSNAANIPGASGREFGFMPVNVLKSVGTTARTAELDFYAFMGEFTTQRYAPG